MSNLDILFNVNYYHWRNTFKKENNYSYQIAIPEKALCDKLYTLVPLNNYTNLENILFNDLRINL